MQDSFKYSVTSSYDNFWRFKVSAAKESIDASLLNSTRTVIEAVAGNIVVTLSSPNGMVEPTLAIKKVDLSSKDQTRQLASIKACKSVTFS